MKKSLATLALISLTFLMGCSTTRVTGALKGGTNDSVRVVALLPIEHPADMSRERVKTVRRNLRADIESRGYVVLDEEIVDSICVDSSCANRVQLVERFNADGFFKTQLRSVARSNFLAGYVNSVTGTVVLENRASEPLISVAHSKVERGGLLFNTGQLAQAVISTAENVEGDDAFANLATAFSKEIAKQIPMAPKRIEDPARVARISKTTVMPQRIGADLICVQGTPNSLAFLTARKIHTNLRERLSGEYCTLIRLADFGTTSEVAVELRSPYGDVDRVLLHEDERTAVTATSQRGS